MKRLPAASEAGVIASRMPDPLDQNPSVSGTLSRKPLTPHSTVNPSSRVVRMFPPSRSVPLEKEREARGSVRRISLADASPAIPPPITMPVEHSTSSPGAARPDRPSR